MDITVFESTTFMELKYEKQFIFATSKVNLLLFKPCDFPAAVPWAEHLAPRQRCGAGAGLPGVAAASGAREPPQRRALFVLLSCDFSRKIRVIGKLHLAPMPLV